MSISPVGTKLVLGPELAGTLMTPEEFDAVEEYDEEYRYELIHGVLVVKLHPHVEVVAPNELLRSLLRDYQQSHAEGTILDTTLPQQYVWSAENCRLADRLIWTGLGRMPNRRRDLPTIVAEFVSEGRRNRQRDYVDKRREYMEAGIAEYWIIDRFQRTMTVILNQPGGPEERVIRENEVYETPRLPGFRLPLAQLLAVADRWAQSE
jgi:Uma2 family endonuclease